MSEPFIFHFRKGDDGHPEVMYITDLECSCGLCGHMQYQRFYHSTPFHAFTLDVFERLADLANEKADYDCENCGSAVGPEHVGRTALTYGFADDAGLVRIFSDRSAGPGGSRHYQLVPRRRLDPQEMPHWEADPAQGEVYAELDADMIDRILDRPFNVKLAWIELLEDWLEDPEGGAYARIAPGFWVVIDANADLANELIEDIEDDEFWQGYDAADLVVVPLCESTPRDLATHSLPESMPGRWSKWLPRHLLEAFDEGRLWADAHMSRTIVVETLKRAFNTARLTYVIDHTGADVFFSQITTPTGGLYGRGVAISSILQRAVFTGLTPGDSARLTAEEIIGVMLKVWK